MSIAFPCVSCGHLIRVGDQLAGKRGKCPRCGTAMTVPLLSAAPPPVPSAPLVAAGPAHPAADSHDPFANFAASGDEPLIRPPSRRRRSKVKLFVVLLIFLILLGGAGYFAYFYFFGVAAGLREEERYFPSGTAVVVSVRVDELFGSETWKAIKKEYKDAEQAEKGDGKSTHLKPTDIDRITVAATAKGEFVEIVRSKKELKAADVVSEAKARFKERDIKVKESTVGGHTLYAPDEGFAFCVVSGRLILMGKADALEAVLKRGTKPEFSADFEAVYKAADFSKTAALAVNVAVFAEGKKSGELLRALPLRGREVLDFFPEGAKSGEILEGVQGAALDVKAGSDVAVLATVICKDAPKAESLRKLIEESQSAIKKGMKDQAPKELLALLDGVKLSANGRTVTATVTTPVTPLLKAIRETER